MAMETHHSARDLTSSSDWSASPCCRPITPVRRIGEGSLTLTRQGCVKEVSGRPARARRSAAQALELALPLVVRPALQRSGKRAADGRHRLQRVVAVGRRRDARRRRIAVQRSVGVEVVGHELGAREWPRARLPPGRWTSRPDRPLAPADGGRNLPARHGSSSSRYRAAVCRSIPPSHASNEALRCRRLI